jgi:phosphopantetheinyl transferase
MPRSRTSRSCWRRPEAEVAVHILRFKGRGRPAERIASRVAARICVRGVLGTDLDGCDVEIARDLWGVPWGWAGGRRIPLSLSHSDGWAAAAAHPHARVGIDVEPAHELPERFARYFLSPDEVNVVGGWADRPTALLSAWTVKEAVSKATGRGLSVPPSALRIRAIGPDGRATVTIDRAEVCVASWREEGAILAVACAETSDLPELSISRSAM